MFENGCRVSLREGRGLTQSVETKPQTHFMKTHPSRFRRQSGFTLVELLVSIVIVAALASVVFAVSIRVKEKANASVCVSNLRQVGGIMNGAAVENNGLYPHGGPPQGWIRRLVSLTDSAYPNTGGSKDSTYFRDGGGQIFNCPSDKDGCRDLHKSYLANPWVVGVKTGEGEWLGNGAFSPRRVQTIRQPARVFLLVEDWTRDSPLWRGNGLRYRGDLNKDTENPAHGEGRHYLYVDGHVDFLAQDPGLTDEGYATHYQAK